MMIKLNRERKENVKSEIIRDKTSTIFGNGVVTFIKNFERFMKGGNVGIIYQDKKMADMIAQNLDPALYNVKYYNNEDDFEIPDHIKGIIAIGGQDELQQAKILSKDKMFFYYCLFPNLEMFTCYSLANNKKYKFAEFVYFDNSILQVRDTKIAFSIYQCLFSLITECIQYSYYESMFPFQNRAIIGIIDSIKKLLINGIDEDKFLRESVRLMKIGVETLTDSEQCVFVSSVAKKKYNLSRERIFMLDYFINILMLYFTKWDFFDMLIPAKEIIIGVNSNRPNWRGMAQNQLLSQESLKIIAKKVECLIEMPYVNMNDNIMILQKIISKDTPLLAEIHNRGILEGLRYEGFKGH